MFNPMMLAQAMRSGQTPMQFVQQMAMQDPRAAQAARLLEGKTPKQIEQMARNMCRERGIDPDAVIRQLTGGM